MRCKSNNYEQKNRVFTCWLLAGLLLCGCSKTQLSAPDSSLVSFTIEWPTTKSDESAKTGAIYLYPLAGGEPIVLSGVGDKSASISVPQGDYNVIVYNENLSAVRTRGPEIYDQFEAFLEPQPKTVNNTSATVIPTADYLYTLTGNANRKISVLSGESYGFKLKPEPATKTFRFIVTVASNIELMGISGGLTGVASRLNLSQVKVLPENIYSIEIPFDFNPTTRVEDILALGSIETFGVDPVNRDAGSNMLHLEVFPKTPNPNLQTRYSYDLTADFNGLEEQSSNIDILIEIGSPDPGPNPDPDPDPGPDPGDRVVLTIKVTIKPWTEEDGGIIESFPTP